MGSDTARVSYDESRQYRSVVMQQGRVTLEADWNEAQLIGTEEERREALDFVGPAGTPDDGYRVLETGKADEIFDFLVGKGTMYVGGVRAELEAPVDYATQLDWQNHSTDPDWVDPASVRRAPGHEWIGLLLREQEVSAVEDTALREVALGGPDTAQRTRLVQHIVRVATDASDCPGGLKSAIAKLATEGLSPDPDPDSMRLRSETTLVVTFPAVTTPPDPCEPQPVGGYLGADNQLIRVQVASVDANGVAQLVWGYDNASFLYRVAALDANNVRLQSSPPDASRQPRARQAIEILRAGVQLDAADYMAAPTGTVFTLAKPYDPDGRIVALPAPGLDPVYLDQGVTPAMFLRVWEQVLRLTPDTPILLGSTGVQVTLHSNTGVFHVGDYWIFAARPSTATQIYPRRYLDGPQWPDGPRLWYCPLAVIGWTANVLKVLEDCRKPFDNLVTLTRTRLGGCCTVTVSPEQFTGAATLQAVLDRFRNSERMTICLLPGHYKLDQPLRLGAEHSNITLEACHDGAVIEAADGAGLQFLDGLLVLDHANNVTLRGLRFHLPQVPFQAAHGRLVGLDSAALKRIQASILEDLMVSIGVRPIHCALLSIEGCLFRFSLTESRDVLGIGVFAGSECWGLRLKANRFLHEEAYLRSTDRLFRFLMGYALAPDALSQIPGRANSAARAATISRTLLTDAVIEENLFDGLTLALLAIAEFGVIKVQGNQVRNCEAGLWFLSSRMLAQLQQLSKVTVVEGLLASGRTVAAQLNALIAMPMAQLGIALTMGYPLPAHATAHQARIQVTATPEQAQARAAAAMQRLFDRTLPLMSPPANAAGVAQPTAAARRAARTATPAKTAPADATAAAAAAAQPAGTPVLETAAPRNTRAAALSEHVLTIGQAAVASSALERRLALAMAISDNRLHTLVSQTAGAAALVVIDDDQDGPSTVTMSGNSALSVSAVLPAVMLAFMDACTVTGNIVGNEGSVREQGQAVSLTLVPLPASNKNPAVAVTGNVFGGTPGLPARPSLTPPAPPPMDSWLFFNTVA